MVTEGIKENQLSSRLWSLREPAIFNAAEFGRSRLSGLPIQRVEVP